MRAAVVGLAVTGFVTAVLPAAAADLSYPVRSERRVVVREVIVAPVELVPACYESVGAVLLHCAPRAETSEAESYGVALRRRSMLTHPRKPYPQLFSWDYP